MTHTNEISEETALQLSEAFKPVKRDIEYEKKVIASFRKHMVLSIGEASINKIESYLKFSFKYPLNRIKFLLLRKSAVKEMQDILNQMNEAVDKVGKEFKV